MVQLCTVLKELQMQKKEPCILKDLLGNLEFIHVKVFQNADFFEKSNENMVKTQIIIRLCPYFCTAFEIKSVLAILGKCKMCCIPRKTGK